MAEVKDNPTMASVKIKPVGKNQQQQPRTGEFRNEFHHLVHDFAVSRSFVFFIMFIIMLNTVMMIAQTWTEIAIRGEWYFTALDSVFLGIYIMEIVIKIYVFRAGFFKEGWNILDFTIVVFSVLDFALPLVIANMGGFDGVAIFRVLRIFRAVRAIRALRVLRTIRFLSNLQVIVTTLLQSIKSIGAIVSLIGLFMYMFAVIGRGLYSKADPEHFGSLFDAFFTMFQLLTLDEWFHIYTVVNNKDNGKYWHIILYLLFYIVVEYFIFLNLFVAVLVDNFQLTLEAQNEANRRKKKELNDSDDEDNEAIEQDFSDVSSDSDVSEDRPLKKPFQEYYPNLTDKNQSFLKHYLSLLLTIEHTSQELDEQQRLLDFMVDMCAEPVDDM